MYDALFLNPKALPKVKWGKKFRFQGRDEPSSVPSISPMSLLPQSLERFIAYVPPHVCLSLQVLNYGSSLRDRTMVYSCS